jgi:hypothetical protein
MVTRSLAVLGSLTLVAVAGVVIGIAVVTRNRRGDDD